MKRTSIIGSFSLTCFLLLTTIVSLPLAAPPSPPPDPSAPKYDATGTWDYKQTLLWEDCESSIQRDEEGTLTIEQNGNNFTLRTGEIPYEEVFRGGIYADTYHTYETWDSGGCEIAIGETLTFRLESSSVAHGYKTVLHYRANIDNRDRPCSQILSFEMTKQRNCTPSDIRMCLQDGRFSVSVTWEDQYGNTGKGQAIPSTDNSGMFWFFGPNNLELLIKVLDGCSINNHYWVFFAATTDQKFTVKVTDLATKNEVEYTNPLKNLADAVTDTSAFATCP